MIDFHTIQPLTIVIFSSIVIFAAFIHGTLGIGFPLVSTPLIALFVDVRTAILILVIPTMANNIANMIRGGNWGKSLVRYWPLAVYGMIGSYVGAFFLVRFSGDFFRPFLAGMIILYLNIERLGLKFNWIHLYPRLALAVTGILAGIMGGTVNVMLPVLIIYALESRMKKTVMIQTFNFCFFLGKLTQFGVFAQNHMISMELLYLAVPLSILGLGAMFFGMTIRDRMSSHIYRQWLRGLLAVMAGVLLIQYVW